MNHMCKYCTGACLEECSILWPFFPALQHQWPFDRLEQEGQSMEILQSAANKVLLYSMHGSLNGAASNVCM